jgi:uncharacterized protein YutE (UPF0331/DUF86 family)
MVLKNEVILDRLKEIDVVLEELYKYNNKTQDEIVSSLSLRWIIERGLITIASVIFDIADHILSASFSIYSSTYEDSLKLLKEKNVISEDLYKNIKGLGGFRNILIHEYMEIDINELYKNFKKSFKVFPMFSKEIYQYLTKVSQKNE